MKAIVGLISIIYHFWKLNGRYYLYYASILFSHTINSFFDTQYTKNHPPHRFAIPKLTVKQQANLKSPIKDVNECLNGINKCFNSLHLFFSSGSRVVNHFPSRITFHSPSSSSDKDFYYHLQNLNQVFRSLQTTSHDAAIIVDGNVKKSHVTTVAAYIWSDNFVIKQLQIQSVNVTSIKAELMVIYIGLIYAMDLNDIHDIIIITNSIFIARKILESKVNLL